jgi:hypothetical protein
VHNLPEEAFNWYLDLRRYGSVLRRLRNASNVVQRGYCGIGHVRNSSFSARVSTATLIWNDDDACVSFRFDSYIELRSWISQTNSNDNHQSK